MNRRPSQRVLRKLSASGWLVGLWLVVATDGLLASSAPKADERVVLYPTLGWRVPGGWEIEIQGCVFEPERRTLAAPLLRRVLGIDGEELTAAEKTLFRERARLLLVDHQEGRSVDVRLSEATGPMPLYPLGPSAGNGQMGRRIRLPDAQFAGVAGVDCILRIEALSPGATNRVLAAGRVHLLAETGWSVITDIDDTIKVSQVRERHELLLNTFCRPLRPVAGMAALYAEWAGTHRAQFHYVSASPTQLYPALEEFVRSNGFPAGTFHLRHLRVKDGTALDLGEPPDRYKLAVIGPLLERYPGRRFVLVGDTGEKDPEVYSELVRRFPQQIRAVYLRDVADEGSDWPRCRKLFADLPRVRWQVFKEPAELPRALP